MEFLPGIYRILACNSASYDEEFLLELLDPGLWKVFFHSVEFL
jgi:hypothetical protein